MLAWVAAGNLRLPSVELRLVEAQQRVSERFTADGTLEARWRGKSHRFVFECKALSTPKSVETAAAQARLYADLTGLSPLVIVPYLAEERLRFLEQAGVSGLDLAGNAVLLAPQFSLWRSGQPNQIKTSLPTRNVFRGNSSLLARCFLLRPEFASLTALREYAVGRLSDSSEAALAKGTVSKVARSLEEEQIVRRERGKVTVADAARLMEELRANYRPPAEAPLVGKTTLTASQVWQALETLARTRALRYAATGLSSAAYYRVLSGPDTLALTVEDADAVAEAIALRPTRAFPNVEIVQETAEAFYFDSRRAGGAVWASPIQTWLELATGGPREREAASVLGDALARSRGEQLP